MNKIILLAILLTFDLADSQTQDVYDSFHSSLNENKHLKFSKESFGQIKFLPTVRQSF